MKEKRSSRIIMTTEARVLKEMRIAKGLSMRKAGNLINKSDSYIAHVEGGRMDVPNGEKLTELLNIYGAITLKSFKERVRLYRQKKTPRDELVELIDRMDTSKVDTILRLATSLVS